VGGDLTKSQWSLAVSLGVRDRICSLGFVSDEDLVSLYNLSNVVLLPSFCEGFGFPILEGIACGVPVITSRVLSMPELGGEIALYIDPKKPEEIADKIIAVVNNPELRSKMKALGFKHTNRFTWDNTAARTLAVYSEIVK